MSMQNAFRRWAALALVAAPILLAPKAHATTVNINYTGMNGYTAAGRFTYNGATAPTVITEANGLGATSTIQSFAISFYNPSKTLLETGSTVVNGMSSDNFFRLTYNTATNTISTLDADVGGAYTYFLTNLRTPTGSVVPTGQTTFNFFNRTTANAALDTATSIQSTVVPTVANVPEPSTWSVLLAGGLSAVVVRLGTGRRYRSLFRAH